MARSGGVLIIGLSRMVREFGLRVWLSGDDLMRQDTWDAINTTLKRFPDLRAEGVEFVEIEMAALELEVRFPVDYAEYLRRYGSAQMGHYPIFGPRRSSLMGRIHGTVVEATRRFRRYHSPESKEWIIFSMDSSGNPIGFDEGGKVWVHHQETGERKAMAESFEAYLRLVCRVAKGSGARQSAVRRKRIAK
jgi:hypothetical protein